MLCLLWTRVHPHPRHPLILCQNAVASRRAACSDWLPALHNVSSPGSPFIGCSFSKLREMECAHLSPSLKCLPGARPPGGGRWREGPEEWALRPPARGGGSRDEASRVASHRDTTHSPQQDEGGGGLEVPGGLKAWPGPGGRAQPRVQRGGRWDASWGETRPWGQAVDGTEWGQGGQFRGRMVETPAPRGPLRAGTYEAGDGSSLRGGRAVDARHSRRKLGSYSSRSDMNNALSQFRLNQQSAQPCAVTRLLWRKDEGGVLSLEPAASTLILVGTLQMEQRVGGSDGATAQGSRVTRSGFAL